MLLFFVSQMPQFNAAFTQVWFEDEWLALYEVNIGYLTIRNLKQSS